MANGRFVQEYQKGAVNGASPLQLVIMLYDGAIRFMEAGKYGIEHKDLELQNQNLQKAQRIVMELMSCLDMDKGGEIAKNLLALYSYVLNELVEANVGDKIEPIDRCIKILCELRESWVEVEKMTRVQAHEAPLAA
ncbi:MAG: flagellar export chaperone FliS [Fimbriimonadaceae bacterium]|nr:flagellar export chaperone FliS [Fimbriimonadaceae bacterium]